MDGVWLASTEVSVDVSVAVRVSSVGGEWVPAEAILQLVRLGCIRRP